MSAEAAQQLQIVGSESLHAVECHLLSPPNLRHSSQATPMASETFHLFTRSVSLLLRLCAEVAIATAVRPLPEPIFALRSRSRATASAAAFAAALSLGTVRDLLGASKEYRIQDATSTRGLLDSETAMLRIGERTLSIINMESVDSECPTENMAFKEIGQIKAMDSSTDISIHKNGWSLSNILYNAAMPPIPVPDPPPIPRPPPIPDSSNNKVSSITTDFLIKGSSTQFPLESFSNAEFQGSQPLPPPPKTGAFEGKPNPYHKRLLYFHPSAKSTAQLPYDMNALETD
nr:beach domain-containing protein C2 [Ipomoea batatas]